MRLIAPNDFDFAAAVEGLVTAVVGGSTMFLGPLLGSGFQTMVPEIQRAVGVEAGLDPARSSPACCCSW